MRKTLALLLAALFLVSPVLAVFANFGVASAGPARLNPQYLWQKQYEFPAGTQHNYHDWNTPTVVDGVVYVGVTTGVNCYPFWLTPPEEIKPTVWGDVYAYNASTGEQIWDYTDDSVLFYGAPAVEGNLVFVSAGRGISYGDINYVKALDIHSGKQVWNRTFDAEVSPPVVSNGVVYVGNKYVLYALEASSGREIWNATSIHGTLPVVYNGVIYVGFMFGGPNANDEFIPEYSMEALDAATGEFIWNYSTAWWVSTPAILDSTVFFTAHHDLYALDAVSGAKIWNYTIQAEGDLHPECYNPSAVNGIVYVMAPDAKGLMALKAADGEFLWKAVNVLGNPTAVVDGVGYIYFRGSFSAINAYTGQRLWDSSLSAQDLNSIPTKATAIETTSCTSPSPPEPSTP